MGLSGIHTMTYLDEHINDLIQGLMIPGLCLTFLVLCAYAYAAWHPVSKNYLNRVSFRLLVYALVANLIFGTTFLIGTLITGPSAKCNFVAFLTNLSLAFSAGMFFCMALNLQLVLVHHINGQTMEKYYIIGISLVCAVCNITPYASGQLGWDRIDETCWFNNPDRAVRLRWLIGTQTFWLLLMANGEIVAFLVIVGYIISHKLTIRRYRQHYSEESGTYDSAETAARPIMKYRNVILRIGLYPLLSCLMNFTGCTLDLYQVKYSILTELEWRLGVADLAIYCVRPFFYAMLAAADPAFIRAIRALRRPVHSVQQQCVTFEVTLPAGLLPVGNVQELYPVDRSHVREETADDRIKGSITQTMNSGDRRDGDSLIAPPPRRSTESARIDVGCQL
ncbi:hypothetical protein B0H11DRAFT_2093008 [Mycena galericulata]|nr:hypothetical protein B0H11DRAFT_2093008 [Mycena galericulata]